VTDNMALAHEWLDAPRGSEKVFLEMCDIFPAAARYALTMSRAFAEHVGPGFLEGTTRLDHELLRQHRALTLPLMPMAWRSMPHDVYETVLTSHHAFAAQNRLARKNHLVYVHSPARYVWTPELDGRGASAALAPLRWALKRVDRSALARVTAVAANSSEVAQRIERYWGRASRVIFPPVDIAQYSYPSSSPPVDGPYILFVGRLVGYKRPDFAIALAAYTKRRLVIVGQGPMLSPLKAQAERLKASVSFHTTADDTSLRSFYQYADALIFPGTEDFGIVPVEAQAAGTPVIALAEGGVRDTVVHQLSGLLIDDLDLDAFSRALVQATQLSKLDCRFNASRFSKEQFRESLSAWVGENS
jgi:glycosyltransferase involved in cell wall biosynthesis